MPVEDAVERHPAVAEASAHRQQHVVLVRCPRIEPPPPHAHEGGTLSASALRGALGEARDELLRRLPAPRRAEAALQHELPELVRLASRPRHTGRLGARLLHCNGRLGALPGVVAMRGAVARRFRQRRIEGRKHGKIAELRDVRRRLVVLRHGPWSRGRRRVGGRRAIRRRHRLVHELPRGLVATLVVEACAGLTGLHGGEPPLKRFSPLRGGAHFTPQAQDDGLEVAGATIALRGREPHRVQLCMRLLELLLQAQVLRA
mmetsp:Transcript_74556/g.216271  ORF Transcript_74556/g.216271 Transcript_74556/m.216271 type:complete len:260 (+) Transcript_74556:879-1658(+)